MQRTAFAMATALVTAAPAALAGGGGFQDYARVTGIEPQYEQVNVPATECYSEYVPQAAYGAPAGRIAGPLIGGVAGGLLGAQVGKGNGKVAAAAAGAAIGALVGDRVAARNAPPPAYYQREVQRCRTVDHWESRIAAYRVAYEYRGYAYTTVLPYDPGPTLPVTVSVSPAPDRLARYSGWNGGYPRE